MKINNEKIQILREKDFTKFISTPIKSIGKHRRTICPFHSEKTPSFYIYRNNSYYCFGCNAHGNAIDFLIKKHGYSFEHACKILEEILWQTMNGLSF